MISVVEAIARVSAQFRPTAAEEIALEDASGRVLAANVYAKLDQPPAPVSAMDGYAVRASDVTASGASLRVIGVSPAGHPFPGHVTAGEAVRIFTGGVVPEGADAVLIQENATVNGDGVTFSEAAIPGRHIRKAALDFGRGTLLASAGQRLRARDLALLAAGDVAALAVRRRPVVAFASTGDELSRPGTARKPGGIVASSGYGLKAMIEAWGGEARDLGILADTVEALSQLPERSAGADLIVTIGGASVGDHDLVRDALAPRGFVLDFWKIAMRPGKPLIFGKLGATPLLGLPGNPVSSLVCAILFLKPALRTMLGEAPAEEFRRARLDGDLAANDSRQDYLRARVTVRDGTWWAAPFPLQDSSMQKALASADGLIVRAPHSPATPTGSWVDVLPLDDI